MAKAKISIELMPGVKGIVTIDVSIPEKFVPYLPYGVDKEERENLCSQKLNDIILLLGGDEEAA